MARESAKQSPALARNTIGSLSGAIGASQISACYMSCLARPRWAAASQSAFRSRIRQRSQEKPRVWLGSLITASYLSGPQQNHLHNCCPFGARSWRLYQL